MPAARSRRVRVRFSEPEHAALVAKAREAGLFVSALLRDHLGKVRIRHRTDEQRRIALLNRINANLNTLTRFCNLHKCGADATGISNHLSYSSTS